MQKGKAAEGTVVVRGVRKSREDWIAVARKVLATAGIESVKIRRLADDLQATRGSFYWHFSGRKDLLKALLQDWEFKNHVAVAAIRKRWVRSTPDLNELVDWFGGRTGLPGCDPAIRVWARSAANVDLAMHRVDEEWIELLQLLFPAGMYDESERLVRARVVYFHRVGYEALAARESQSEHLRLIPYYYKVFVGREPSGALNEFCSRCRALEIASASSTSGEVSPKSWPALS